MGAGEVAQPARAGSAPEGGQVQAREAAGARCPAEAHPNRPRGAEDAAAPGPGEVGDMGGYMDDIRLLIPKLSVFFRSQAAPEIPKREGRVGGSAKPGADQDGEAGAKWGPNQQLVKQETKPYSCGQLSLPEVWGVYTRGRGCMHVYAL
jgi:hypothetical protein